MAAEVEPPDEFSRDDWERLAELRAEFLRAETGMRRVESYWHSRRDLELYELTFAQRIGWKWDAVLRELELRGALPGGERVVDWGCGTGIAARKFLARSPGVKHVSFADRSKQACWFARDALLAERPGIEITLHAPAETDAIDVLLVSHVLDELADEGLESLLALVRRSRAVIWLESAGQRTSRALSKQRDALLESFDVLAPCTHREACGALASERDWCHFFARPPAEAFTSAFWRRFGDELGLDLRSLAYAFVALRRRGEVAPNAEGAQRWLGRPRLLKGRALIQACTPSGLRELTLLERTDKQLFKRLDRSAGEALVFDVALEGERIASAVRRFEAP